MRWGGWAGGSGADDEAGTHFEPEKLGEQLHGLDIVDLYRDNIGTVTVTVTATTLSGHVYAGGGWVAAHAAGVGRGGGGRPKNYNAWG